MPPVSTPSATRRSGVIAAVTASLLLGACASGGTDPLTAGAALRSADTRAQGPKTELQQATEYWGKAHAENPADPRAAVNYARNLKALGAKSEALTVLQAAHQRSPHDRALNSEYGRLALEHQQFSVAETLLTQADDPANPDWRTISARGAVMAKQGRHHEAIPFFQRALDLAPEQASIQNNLAMAYAMAGQPGKAEPLLRQAASKNPEDARIAQNLALVLGLQGRHDEAKTAAAGRVAEETLQHNADLVRQIVPTIAPTAVAEAAPAGPAPARPAAAAKGRSTASLPAAAKGPAAKTDAPVDAAELVRRLADGDSAPAPTAVAPTSAVPPSGAPTAAAATVRPTAATRAPAPAATGNQGPFRLTLPATSRSH
jgi:Flp pilus assembly protein TadD